LFVVTVLFAASILGNFEKVTNSERSMSMSEANRQAQSNDPYKLIACRQRSNRDAGQNLTRSN
jgi:archaellum component FlaG (FlaF/FlaG flagellin family)